MKTRYPDIPSYVTKDGSIIRELMHPAMQGASHGCTQQSLAEAEVAVGGKTALHRHQRSEELYHVTQGTGRMTLGDESFSVEAGDTICIQPGVAHCIENLGAVALRILCCCSPPYDHEDTEILD